MMTRTELENAMAQTFQERKKLTDRIMAMDEDDPRRNCLIERHDCLSREWFRLYEELRNAA